MKKEKVLIGVGCSHTQGCAFATREGKWMSKELEEKYEVDCTQEYITNNLTWMAKLNNYLKYDKILNFGMGGEGVEANIRSIRNYIYKNNDLNNHLVVHQIPSLTRQTVLWDGKIMSVHDAINIDIYNQKTYYKNRKFIQNDNGFIKGYDIWYNAYRFLFEVYWIQDLIESKGGIYRCFSFEGFSSIDRIFPIDELKKWENEMQSYNYEIVPFNSEYHQISNFIDIIQDLNYMTLGNMNTTGKRLRDQNLVKDDGHFAEDGNEVVGKQIYENLFIENNGK